ncbi:MAG: DUF3330 domain-containing protein [Coxiellaceae bacterium]|nr:DUF3330 domain-containing protein [Coxiellaceae bacterium]
MSEDQNNQSSDEQVECSACHKHLEKSMAMHAESAEYVHYFCGESCLKHWQEKHS